MKELIKELGVKVNYNDTITIDGKNLSLEEKEYILLYKPRGVVTTTSDEHNRKTVLDLVDTDKRLYPVGRLDYDTSGIIILTNDGELANLLMHPKCEINKTYVAKVKGLVHKEEILRLSSGVVIDGFETSPAGARILSYDKKSKYYLKNSIKYWQEAFFVTMEGGWHYSMKSGET